MTEGCPRVIVPVLSSTTILTDPARSRASDDLINTPMAAPLPVPTMMAVGVASPMAQGQAITNTATMLINARVKGVISALTGSGGPNSIHPVKVIRARTITIGTNTAETRSASFWMGALLPCASSTRRMICASAVSLPIFVASNFRDPSLLIVPPITPAPDNFSTGSDSPVNMDSSTEECPSITTPSTGIFSPGLTRTRSPMRTSSISTSISRLSRMMCAVFGRSPISFLMASLVRPFARASRNLPNLISVMITAAVSK